MAPNYRSICALLLIALIRTSTAASEPIPVVLWHGWLQKVSSIQGIVDNLHATLGPNLYVLTLQFGTKRTFITAHTAA